MKNPSAGLHWGTYRSSGDVTAWQADPVVLMSVPEIFLSEVGSLYGFNLWAKRFRYRSATRGSAKMILYDNASRIFLETLVVDEYSGAASSSRLQFKAMN